MHCYGQGAIQLEVIFASEDLRVLVDKLNMSNGPFGQIKLPGLYWKRYCQQVKGGNPYLLLSTAKTSGVVSYLRLPNSQDMNIPE